MKKYDINRVQLSSEAEEAWKALHDTTVSRLTKENRGLTVGDLPSPYVFIHDQELGEADIVMSIISGGVALGGCRLRIEKKDYELKY